jgi:hypothetical protein
MQRLFIVFTDVQMREVEGEGIKAYKWELEISSKVCAGLTSFGDPDLENQAISLVLQN